MLELLRGISGAFRPGVLTALVGVSGAGKVPPRFHGGPLQNGRLLSQPL